MDHPLMSKSDSEDLNNTLCGHSQEVVFRLKKWGCSYAPSLRRSLFPAVLPFLPPTLPSLPPSVSLYFPLSIFPPFLPFSATEIF